jgi:hypothetical protein
MGFLFGVVSYTPDNPNAIVFLDKVVVKEMNLLVPTPTPMAGVSPARWLLYE